MRKILYSPGYGAGWVSWFSGTKEQQLFMLEYKPFIEFLSVNKGEIPDRLIKLFMLEWSERFPDTDPPFDDGIKKLKIYEVRDGEQVRIEEYDGAESVRTRVMEEDRWL